jgi:putative acetyltransferase
MTKIIRTDSTDENFILLIKLLDRELAERDGDQHSFYAQYNKIDMIKNVFVAFENDKPVSCGAMKKHSTEAMEIKRTYTLPEYRSFGIATKILIELENWAKELYINTVFWKSAKDSRRQYVFIQRMAIK